MARTLTEKNRGMQPIQAMLAVFIVGLFVGSVAQADTYDPHPLAISFFNVVDPGMQNTNWASVVVGTEQLHTDKLHKLIGPEGEYVLRIRTIQAFIQSNSVPAPQDYARLAVAACSENGGIRGFGAGQIVVAGSDHTAVTYNPGLVAVLTRREALCTSSQLQSVIPAVVQVHGYLEKK